MKVSLSAFLLLTFCLLRPAFAEHIIRFAVGPDHVDMMNNNYSIYKANWEFLDKSLNSIGIKLAAKSMPWARAKASVQSGQNHGLFLAANFDERNKWAQLSLPLGYEVFGSFVHRDCPTANKTIAAVRLGGSDRILSYLKPDKLLTVSTAQHGLMLLHSQRVDRFIMAKGYGKYILENDLSDVRDDIIFDDTGAELRSLHIAVAKDNKVSLAALEHLNQAIEKGMKAGWYQDAMTRYNVPPEMVVKQED